MKFLLLIPLLLCCGCQSGTTQHGIANFAIVEPGVYRGGQPTQAGWDWLHTNCVTKVVKLNLESEGSDAYAEALGMTVYRYPITLEEQMFDGLKTGMASDAVGQISQHTFIHCEHGQDRTGLIVAEYRTTKGWSKVAAENEMLGYGFHKSLLGLWETWESFKP